jgi:NADH:ubiquinone reductase (non-electrogenic)
MASTTTRAMMKLPASSIGLGAAARRSFATSSSTARNHLFTRARPASLRVTLDKSKFQQAFRRTYADVAPAKKPKRFRLIKFLWRFSYLSAIVGVGYLAYGVWELRHPEEQFEPDPTKKNLVILGTHTLVKLRIALAN